MKSKSFLLPIVIVVALFASASWAKYEQKQIPARRQSSMGRIAIVGYKPKPGKADALKQLARTHVQRLRAEGLVTSREPIIMEANDGTIIEVFEWKSKEAIESAHTNPAVQVMWKEYAEVCDYVPVSSIEEAKQLFTEFTPL
jgi:quinol monooxygenase YgiN